MIGKLTKATLSVIMLLSLASCATTRERVDQGFPPMQSIYEGGVSHGKRVVDNLMHEKMSEHPELGQSLQPMIPIRQGEVVEWCWIPNHVGERHDRFIEGHRIWYVRRHAYWWADRNARDLIRVSPVPKTYGIPFQRVQLSSSNGSVVPSDGNAVPQDQLSSAIHDANSGQQSQPSQQSSSNAGGSGQGSQPSQGAFQ